MARGTAALMGMLLVVGCADRALPLPEGAPDPSTDLAARDMAVSVPDLSAPDLATPSTPDLSRPDLAASDLATNDLAGLLRCTLASPVPLASNLYQLDGAGQTAGGLGAVARGLSSDGGVDLVLVAPGADARPANVTRVQATHIVQSTTVDNEGVAVLYSEQRQITGGGIDLQLYDWSGQPRAPLRVLRPCCDNGSYGQIYGGSGLLVYLTDADGSAFTTRLSLDEQGGSIATSAISIGSLLRVVWDGAPLELADASAQLVISSIAPQTAASTELGRYALANAASAVERNGQVLAAFATFTDNSPISISSDIYMAQVPSSPQHLDGFDFGETSISIAANDVATLIAYQSASNSGTRPYGVTVQVLAPDGRVAPPIGFAIGTSGVVGGSVAVYRAGSGFVLLGLRGASSARDLLRWDIDCVSAR